MKKKIEEEFFVLDTTASEFVAFNCLYQEANTFYWESVS